MDAPLWAWVATIGAVFALLALDLLVLNRSPHEIGLREAARYSAFFISCGVAFGGVLLVTAGGDAAGAYMAGYLVELSLSLDNVFVFALVFAYFGIPNRYQHKVLFWGIIGALVFRGVFIAAGIALLELLHWAIYLFGAFLVFTAVRMARTEDIEVHPDRNIVLRLLKRIVPVTSEMEGERFLLRRGGVLVATPLLGALVTIEALDIVFAVDSVPAILAVTREPFLVFSATAFAILGLRALYFVLAGAIPKFPYLHYGLAAILGFVGVKMLIVDVYDVPIPLSLGIIALILATAVVASVIRVRRDRAGTPVAEAPPQEEAPPTGREAEGSDPMRR